MIIHPMSTYISVDARLYFPVKKSFKTIPLNAMPQLALKIAQPVGPLSVINENGV